MCWKTQSWFWDSDSSAYFLKKNMACFHKTLPLRTEQLRIHLRCSLIMLCSQLNDSYKWTVFWEVCLHHQNGFWAFFLKKVIFVNLNTKQQSVQKLIYHYDSLILPEHTVSCSTNYLKHIVYHLHRKYHRAPALSNILTRMPTAEQRCLTSHSRATSTLITGD